MPGLKFAHRASKLKVQALLILGRKAAAEACLGEMLARWPLDAYALESRAHLRASRGDRGAAIADLRSLVGHAPTAGAPAWFNLGFLLEAEEALPEAEAALRQAVAQDPKLDRAWYGLGLVLVKLGRLDEAIKALKRNTELQPMSPYGWTQLVRVHMNRQEAEEARRIIAHLRGFEPKVAAALARETGLSS